MAKSASFKSGLRTLSGTEDIFLADLHQYDIGTDLTDPVPGDDVFLIRTQEPAEPERAWDDDGADAALLLVQYQVADSSELPAVTAVDDILFL